MLRVLQVAALSVALSALCPGCKRGPDTPAPSGQARSAPGVPTGSDPKAAILPPDQARQRLAELLAIATNAAPKAQSEAIWSVGFAGGHDAAEALEALIGREDLDPEVRADAIVARAIASTHDLGFATRWAEAGPAAVRHAAGFILGRGPTPGTALPRDVAAWRDAVGSGGDASRGRRIFRSPQAGCAKCHVAEGRGAAFGPAFTPLPPGVDRPALIEAIVEPSKAVAAEYRAHLIETRDEVSITALQLRRNADGSTSFLAGPGREMTLKAEEVSAVTPLDSSVMPDGLADILGVEGFRDVLAYLESLK